MSKQPRMACNVKLLIDSKTTVAEVLFYFNMMLHDEKKTFAFVSEFSQLHTDLFENSSQMVFACRYCGDASLKLVEIHTIQSVVAMIPHNFPGIDGVLFYLVEQPGLDIIRMGGVEEEGILDEE
ncbi:uncharacterized protein EDB93DRAFT_1257008 [Suillus bovinus]|uniref:uncharacterized protein n=1 Tax=Suillus bovinus TaxID=48563 RepID=UPI001B865A07|nr:uncharacterized protein EDB93DRAFT_1257008 [Suillus bovinus]KAG2127539.1 hypothetical protein EDB93DRAFT_1257008 [Suillus bovinus]